MGVTVTILGARGSTPATGPDFVRYGGDTSAVALSESGMPPDLLLDAGTGLRGLPDLLGGQPFRGALLLGHLHWDHTHGIPFCRSLDHDDAEVDVYLPAQGVAPMELLARALGPPHFPITPAQLRGRWRFHGLEEGHHDLGDWSIMAREIPHKGGRTFGYRVERAGFTVAYLSDHAPGNLGPGSDGLGELHEAALTLADGADLLLHDAQYTADEYADRSAFGHSSIDYALSLGRAAGVATTGLFHHDPSRSDAELDQIARSLGRGAVVTAQGDTFEL